MQGAGRRPDFLQPVEGACRISARGPLAKVGGGIVGFIDGGTGVTYGPDGGCIY